MRDPDHQMLPKPTPEEAARQRYVLALKNFSGRRLRPLNEAVYEQRANPTAVSNTLRFVAGRLQPPGRFGTQLAHTRHHSRRPRRSGAGARAPVGAAASRRARLRALGVADFKHLY